MPAAALPSSALKSLAWSHGVFTLETLGGMLGPTLFVLPDGRQVAPFHIAPWFDEAGIDSEPGILRRLRGEWPCIPFGAAPDHISGTDWTQPLPGMEPDPDPHGYGSNNPWYWIEGNADELSLAIDYPDTHPIARLTRHIRGIPGEPALEFRLCVEPRRSCDLPIGLHPVFRLASEPLSMHLDIEARAAATYPGRLDPSSIFKPDAILQDWHAVPLEAGGTIDPSRLPLQQQTEDLLQLLGANGKARLTNTAEGYSVTLAWNSAHFPDVLLWISNRGRRHFPWNGRHLALGIEPVSAALDLGTQVSGSDNPIRRSGSPTTMHFTSGEIFETRYRVSVSAAAQSTTAV